MNHGVHYNWIHAKKKREITLGWKEQAIGWSLISILLVAAGGLVWLLVKAFKYPAKRTIRDEECTENIRFSQLESKKSERENRMEEEEKQQKTCETNEIKSQQKEVRWKEPLVTSSPVLEVQDSQIQQENISGGNSPVIPREPFPAVKMVKTMIESGEVLSKLLNALPPAEESQPKRLKRKRPWNFSNNRLSASQNRTSIETICGETVTFSEVEKDLEVLGGVISVSNQETVGSSDYMKSASSGAGAGSQESNGSTSLAVKVGTSRSLYGYDLSE